MERIFFLISTRVALGEKQLLFSFKKKPSHKKCAKLSICRNHTFTIASLPAVTDYVEGYMRRFRLFLEQSQTFNIFTRFTCQLRFDTFEALANSLAQQVVYFCAFLGLVQLFFKLILRCSLLHIELFLLETKFFRSKPQFRLSFVILYIN